MLINGAVKAGIVLTSSKGDMQVSGEEIGIHSRSWNILKRPGGPRITCINSVHDWSTNLFVVSARHVILGPSDFTSTSSEAQPLSRNTHQYASKADQSLRQLQVRPLSSTAVGGGCAYFLHMNLCTQSAWHHRSIKFPVCTYHSGSFSYWWVIHVLLTWSLSLPVRRKQYHAALDQYYTDTAVGAHRIFTTAERKKHVLQPLLYVQLAAYKLKT
jgi:hypothetical protein